MKFWEIKPEIRVIGIDDAPFEFKQIEKVLCVATVYRGGQWIEGVLSTHIEVDGGDSTSKFIEMINGSRHKEQLRVILLDGITYAGFNVVDTAKLCEETGMPVISVTRNNPDLGGIMSALSNLDDGKEKWSVIEGSGEIHEVAIREGENPIYVQPRGIEFKDALAILRYTCTHSLIPEPLRVAHLIAAGVVRGESGGRP